MIKIGDKIANIILILGLVVLMFVSSSAAAGFILKLQDVIDWDKLLVAFKAIEENPSLNNRIKFLSLIPEKYTDNQIGNIEKFLMAINASEKHEKLLCEGDIYIVEATFRLMAYVEPGAYYEDLFISLGKLATDRPRLFLQMLNKYEENFKYEYPVTMTEILDIVPDIITKEDAERQRKEELKLYEKRIKALESVTDPGLLRVRDRCIKEIKEIIERLKRLKQL